MIKAVVNHGAVIPTNSMREVLMGYLKEICLRGK
jgi:hypothetical protein